MRQAILYCISVLWAFSPIVSVSQTVTRQWTLQQCIDYALEHNTQLKKTRLQKLSAEEDVLQSKAELLPSLNASTSQNIIARPWPENGMGTVANGYVQSSVDKVYYNGSYSVNANWTVWNGNRNQNTIKLNELSTQQAELDWATMAKSVEEQIANLYVQILYSKEAVEVNKQSAATSKLNEERGNAFLKVGKMSKADVAQLTAQRAQDEYNVVAAETNVRNYKRQLKQLLQLTDTEEFDIAPVATTDQQALQTIPPLQTVYEAALQTRPEIANALVAIESSGVSMDLAKATNSPTVGLTAGLGTNNTSMSETSWGKQIKNNLSASVGATLNIPLLDNRQAKTAYNKAVLSRQSAQLDLEQQKTQLYSTIESYWIEAMNNQQKFQAAQVALESEQTSYELLSEQFRLGLKNTVELMKGKDNLLMAQQNALQSKYLTILNLQMLKFYQGL